MQTSEALVELRKGLRVFKAFERAEEVAVYLEGAEQNKRELEAAIARLRVELDAAKTQHDAELAALAAEKAAAEQAAAAAKDAAKAAGKAEVEAATRRATKLVDDAAQEVQAAQQARDAALATAATAELRVKAAAEELAEVTRKLEAAKAQIAKLLG